MYAVIETGGKQYRVEVGTELEVERLEVEAGQAITIDRVLLVADGAEASIGRPLVADAIVSAEVLRQDRGEKLISFKYRPKARSRVKKGHRQELTILRVTDVKLGTRSAADEARRLEDARKTERERLEEAAARQAATDQELAARLAAQAPATTEKPARGRGRAGAESAGAAESTAETPRRGRRGEAPEPTAEAPAAEDEGATTSGAERPSGETLSAESTASDEDNADTTEKPQRAPRTKKES